MPRDILVQNFFPQKHRDKSPQMNRSITQKKTKNNIVKSDLFSLWSHSFVKFFHDAFAASSRDQTSVKNFLDLDGAGVCLWVLR